MEQVMTNKELIELDVIESAMRAAIDPDTGATGLDKLKNTITIQAFASRFLNPQTQTLGINYSVTQSKVTIGSAGFFGKGFGQGSQTHLGFLPDAQTDLILSAFIEEWGLFGALILLALFVILFFRILFIGMSADDNVSRFISLGVASALMLNFSVNVGSAIGLMPVVGVPFPFLSYGGSSLLTFFILAGIVTSIASERQARVL